MSDSTLNSQVCGFVFKYTFQNPKLYHYSSIGKNDLFVLHAISSDIKLWEKTELWRVHEHPLQFECFSEINQHFTSATLLQLNLFKTEVRYFQAVTYSFFFQEGDGHSPLTHSIRTMLSLSSSFQQNAEVAFFPNHLSFTQYHSQLNSFWLLQ